MEESLTKLIGDIEVLKTATPNQPRQIAAINLTATAIITAVRGLTEYKTLCEKERQQASQPSQSS